jgi:hypothetical protein
MLDTYYRGTSAARIESWGRFRTTLDVTYVYPLTDRRILEFIYAIPEELHVRDGISRALFRDAMGGVLPDELQWAPAKQESARPEWLMRPVAESERADLIARVAASGFPAHPWVDVERLDAALRAMPANAALPITVEHAIAALTIWRNWGGAAR